MKSLVGVAFAIGAVALASNAVAADLKRPVYKAPPPTPVQSWTGFYVGANAGFASLDKTSMTYTDLANSGNTFNSYVTSTIDEGKSGGLVGLHAGYNWQVAPKWVAGIEGDWDWTGLKAGGTRTLNRGLTGAPVTDNIVLDTKVNWLASIRGRAGYLWDPQLLVYATAGVAFADLKRSNGVFCTNIPLSLCVGGTQSIQNTFNETRVGAAVGAGFDYKFARNWIVGLEYLYYAFDKHSQTGGSWVFANGAPAPFFNCGTPGQNCAIFSYGTVDLHTARARISYQFN